MEKNICKMSPFACLVVLLWMAAFTGCQKDGIYQFG